MEEEKEKTKTREQEKEDGLSRISISKLAEKEFIELQKRVNDGFEAGSVNRSDLASFILRRFSKDAGDVEIREIRCEFADEATMLDALLKRVKATGQMPPELKAFLHKQAGLDDVRGAKPRKVLTKNNINDVIDENE